MTPAPLQSSSYSSSYSSPYSSSYSRYKDFSDSKFSDISPYSTPLVYPRLTRGHSLPSEPLPPLSPHTSTHIPSMLRRQQSEEVGGRSRARDPRDHTRYLDSRDQYSSRSRKLVDSRDLRLHHQVLRDAHKDRIEKGRPISCNKVYDGIIIGNGETIQDIPYLKSLGVTHVLNTAEQHVEVNPGEYTRNGIQYYGFHVDDLPNCNISRYFTRTNDFLHRAVSSGGTAVVNCYMGLSRSATCVLAYLMTKHNLGLHKALELLKQNRSVRPNAGFLRQLEDLETSLRMARGRR